jgi:DNA polymerase-3 subunit epsilon
MSRCDVPRAALYFVPRLLLNCSHVDADYHASALVRDLATLRGGRPTRRDMPRERSTRGPRARARMTHGVKARLAETLLTERAADFLAGGPATAMKLIATVCQLPGTTPMIAERMALALFEGRPEFVRGDDGLWRLASSAAAAEAPALAVPVIVEAPAPIVSASPSPEPARVPTFDEWRAARQAARAMEPAPRAPRPPNESVPDERAPDERAPDERPAIKYPGRPRVAAPPRAPEPGAGDDLRSLSYAVVDVETTGGNPHTGHRITEIAAVVVKDGRIVDIFETLVNPERSIPPMITAITNITWEMVRDKPPFRAVCDDVVRMLEGHVFVAHNVAFDWRFVSAEVARTSGRELQGRRLCTVRLSRKLLPQLPRRSLDWVARHYGADAAAGDYFAERHGPEYVWRHRAAGDAVATAHCLIRLLDDAAARGCTTWGEVETMLATPAASKRRGRRRLSGMPAPVDKDTTA